MWGHFVKVSDLNISFDKHSFWTELTKEPVTTLLTLTAQPIKEPVS